MSKEIKYEKINDTLIRLTFNNGANLGEFVLDVDGEYKYWPPKEGCWSSWIMHLIAVALDNANNQESGYISNKGHKNLIDTLRATYEHQLKQANEKIQSLQSTIDGLFEFYKAVTEKFNCLPDYNFPQDNRHIFGAIEQLQSTIDGMQTVINAYEEFYGVNPEHTSLYAKAHDTLNKALQNQNTREESE